MTNSEIEAIRREYPKIVSKDQLYRICHIMAIFLAVTRDDGIANLSTIQRNKCMATLWTENPNEQMTKYSTVSHSHFSDRKIII